MEDKNDGQDSYGAKDDGPDNRDMKDVRKAGGNEKDGRQAGHGVKYSRPVSRNVKDGRPVSRDVKDSRPVSRDVKDGRPVSRDVKDSGPVNRDLKDGRQIGAGGDEPGRGISVKDEEVLIYVHIPFCERKCAYCDFLSAPPAGEAEIRAYADAVVREIGQSERALIGGIRQSERALIGGVEQSGYMGASGEHGHGGQAGTGMQALSSLKPGVVKFTAEGTAFLPRGTDAVRAGTVFIGGGTPTAVSSACIEEIMGALREVYEFSDDAEITIEANPNSLTKDKLVAYRRLGINRISIGVQSFDDAELRLLGRLHDRERAIEAFYEARQAGFTNINLDIMTALPGQSAKKLEATLDTALSLEPEHLSVYSLIVEEGTPFYERYGSKGAYLLPDEDETLRLDSLVRDMLAGRGYRRYEISNYAREGFECRHNLGYWHRIPYRGYGPGAASLLRVRGSLSLPVYATAKGRGGIEYRFEGEIDLKAYIAGSGRSVFERKQGSLRRLSPRDAMAEFMFLGLRCVSGIDEREFQDFFGCDIMSVYGREIEAQLRSGYMERRGHFLRYTEKGLDVSNILLAEFV